MKDKQLRNYLLWAFGLAWALQGLAAWLFWQGQPMAYQLTLAVSMFAPFAAVLLAKIPLKEMGWVPRLGGKWMWLLAAWFAPAVLTALGAALYFTLLPGRLDLSGGYILAQVGEQAFAQLEAAGLSMTIYFVIQIVMSVTWAPFFNMLLALGEEVGWRGALYPRLKERFGVSRGRLIGGVIWGAWHWPIMVLAGYEYGLSYWGFPVLGMALFCLITVGLGTLMDLAYEKTGCIWIPSLAHGAFNAIAGAPLLVLNPDYADQLTLGPAPMGIIAGLPMLVLAAVVLLRPGEKNGSN